MSCACREIHRQVASPFSSVATQEYEPSSVRPADPFRPPSTSRITSVPFPSCDLKVFRCFAIRSAQFCVKCISNYFLYFLHSIFCGWSRNRWWLKPWGADSLLYGRDFLRRKREDGRLGWDPLGAVGRKGSRRRLEGELRP